MTWAQRRTIAAIWDLLSWVIAIPLATLLRYDFSPPAGLWPEVLLVGLGCGLLHVALGSMLHLYQGRYIVGSFDEVAGVVLTTVIVAVPFTLLTTLFASPEFPRSTVAIGAGIAGAAMLGARFFWRAGRRHSALGVAGARTLIYGAGDAGLQILNLMLSEDDRQFQPCGFVDDDPNKQHLRRGGIRVLGPITELEKLIREYRIETLLVAIAGISAERLLELDRRCNALGVSVRIIPTATEIVGGAVKLGDISDVTEEDLIGRRPIETDEKQIHGLLEGKVILVTGAGGSIGSELSRQLIRYNPKRLLLLDRDESNLHSVQLSIDGTGALTSEDLILADIRDAERLDEIFEEFKPEVVFHAAALKHLPLLERFPDEAVKTNVFGTKNVLEASRNHCVKVFVNISTDKAADPTSVLGYSKLITERLTAGMPSADHAKFVSVRFGNVLGSRGSVIQTFRYQISKGGPVTVTDPDVTRYFMTVGEAVHLVLQAAVLGEHGETLILDMGKPLRILDVAQYMIQRSGRQVSIEFTGIRSGEKLDEALTSVSETVQKGIHPLITHCKVDGLLLTHCEFSEFCDDSKSSLERIANLATT